MADSGSLRTGTTEGTVSRYLRQLGDDIGSDTPGGKALKVTGTVVQGINDWQLSLASNTNLDDVVWRAARIAWRAPITPRSPEMKLFREKIATMLTIDNDKTGSLIRKWTFRSRLQPFVFMRLLSERNMEMGPWLATLVAAVHSGASAAVHAWALQTLTEVGAQGAIDLRLEQEELLILLSQSARAADLLIADLKVIATNEYWRRIPKAMIDQRQESLPPLTHREVVADWWNDIFGHYEQYEMPVYRRGQNLRKGIEFEGRSLLTSPIECTVLTVGEFLDWVRHDFWDALRNGRMTVINDAILSRAMGMLGGLYIDVADRMKRGIKFAARSLVLSSRVATLGTAQNIAGLLQLGRLVILPLRLGRLTRPEDITQANDAIRALCRVVSGSSFMAPATNLIVCIQTPVGLFVPYLPHDYDFQRQPLSPLWQLQAVHLDQLSSNTAVTCECNDNMQSCNDEHAGSGPITNRPLSRDDAISGVVTVHHDVLELICLVRGELVSVNFSRILAKALSLLPVSHMANIDAPASHPEDSVFAYISSDILLRAIKNREVCKGDWPAHLLLALTGNNADWQILSLAALPSPIVIQSCASAKHCIDYCNSVGAIALIPNYQPDETPESTQSS